MKSHLINLSIDTGIVPDELKYAKVKPLYKKNSRLDAGNYRPVSILCIVSKILERAVYVQVEDYLLKNNLLYSNQSGFRKAYSTDTCLIDLTDSIRAHIANGNYVGMVLLDLQKAFDTVDHDILCKKLEAMGLDFTDWFKSYLTDRKQIVIANDTKSEPRTVTCGVPQGSILGPLLFLCYVNDMPISVKCKLLLYADDSALLVAGKDTNLIAEALSNELESCRQWLVDNKLSLHLGKTEAILFGSKRKLLNDNNFNVKCGDVEIQNVKNVKYLGLQLDDDLSGNSIVKGILDKANCRLKFLYRYKEMLNFQARKNLCSALIQCHFDYACSAWYPGINIALRKRLQVMQNKIIRFILGLDNRSHIGNDELNNAGFLKVPDRVKQLMLGHVFKIKNKTSPEYLQTHFLRLKDMENRNRTRATEYDFYTPKINSHSASTFFYTAIKDWNALPPCLKESRSEGIFKDRLKQHLLRVAEEEEENFRI